MTGSDKLRVLGVSLPDVSDRSEPLPTGKWSQFFKALATRVTLVDVVRPEVSRTDRYLNLARSVRPGKTAWAAQSGFNPRYVARLNAALEQQLLARSGSYDLIVQLQTLCTPRSVAVRTPYVIYTDNTMALTQRIYPAFAPLSPVANSRWQRFEADVCRGADAVFTYSQFARQSVIDDYGCRPQRVRAIGAGANQMLAGPGDKDYAGRRALFVGSPFEPKGGKVLLKAWETVQKHVPDAELVIVGPKKNPLSSRDLNVSFRGRVGRQELAGLYGSATVFVLPSLFDAWGHVFVEAMGHALPCIGSNCCAMPELIHDGISGTLVPRGDPAPLADALTELLTNPVQAAAMGRAGYERVARDLTWDRVAERLVRQLSAPRSKTGDLPARPDDRANSAPRTTAG